MDAISLLLSQDDIDLEAVFAALPEMANSSSQTESTIYDLESLVPLGKAIKFANLIGLCLEHNGKGFKPGQIKRLLQLIDRSEALRSFKPLVNEIRDFTSKELEQLLFFSECICEAQ